MAMRKIMFNDKFGLTQAVLEGRKTMTRRVIPKKVFEYWYEYTNYIGREISWSFSLRYAQYKIGEIVAVAQCYYNVYGYETWISERGEKESGVFNKMFVRAESMPHHIKITDIRVEHLQDLSDEDCLREGVYEKKLEYTPSGYNQNRTYYTFDGVNYCFNDARDAFAALIDKVSGKGTWQSNPLVWVYEFELVD